MESSLKRVQDVTGNLSDDDKAELINLVSEPFGYETISQEELDKAISEWKKEFL